MDFLLFLETCVLAIHPAVFAPEAESATETTAGFFYRFPGCNAEIYFFHRFGQTFFGGSYAATGSLLCRVPVQFQFVRLDLRWDTGSCGFKSLNCA